MKNKDWSGNPYQTARMERAAARLERYIPETGWGTPEIMYANGGGQSAETAPSNRESERVMKKIGRRYGLTPVCGFYVRTAPGYWVRAHTDDSPGVDVCAALYLKGSGETFELVDLSIRCHTTPGDLVLFDPKLAHQVREQNHERCFFRMDFAFSDKWVGGELVKTGELKYRICDLLRIPPKYK